MLDAYIYDGIRTPFGGHNGSLAKVRPDDLAGHVIRAVIERGSFDASTIDDILFGCVCQSGEDSRNVARHGALLADVPVEVSAQTINRLCGSSLAAVIDSARAITCGEGDLFIAGGVESMTRAPLVINKGDTAFSRNVQLFDSSIGARFPNKILVEKFGNEAMPQTADNVAADLDLTREDCDRFAFSSQSKYVAAHEAGFFDDELLTVDVPQGRKKPPLSFSVDEHPRLSSMEKLAALRVLNPGGVVTAGSASGINDGAAALVIGSSEFAKTSGMKPIARILGGAAAGVPPRVMGLGPVPASKKVLDRLGLTLADMDLIEINEAFSAQVLGCLKLMELDQEDPRLNPNGGAIALGHPLGASGARLALTAARQLQRTGGRYGLVTMCIGVGQGISMVIENVNR